MINDGYYFRFIVKISIFAGGIFDLSERVGEDAF